MGCGLLDVGCGHVGCGVWGVGCGVGVWDAGQGEGGQFCKELVERPLVLSRVLRLELRGEGGLLTSLYRSAIVRGISSAAAQIGREPAAEMGAGAGAGAYFCFVSVSVFACWGECTD